MRVTAFSPILISFILEKKLLLIELWLLDRMENVNDFEITEIALLNKIYLFDIVPHLFLRIFLQTDSCQLSGMNVQIYTRHTQFDKF